MDTAALALYNALNALIVGKFERGAFASEAEANAYGNQITAAFAEACAQAGENDFVTKFEVLATFADVGLNDLTPLSTTAAALYDVINQGVSAKFEAGDFASAEEANAYGNSITVAFSEACVEAGEDDFITVFAAKLP
jgi:hypothetical protein